MWRHFVVKAAKTANGFWRLGVDLQHLGVTVAIANAAKYFRKELWK